MLNTIIGGLIALTSGIVVGILTPTINSRIQNKKIIQKQFLRLCSILYLIKNNLSNYLKQEIFIDVLGENESGEEEIKRLENLSRQINFNIDDLYQVQQEIITNFTDEINSIALIYEKLDDIDNFIWSKKMNFNNDKEISDSKSSDDYSIALNNMLELYLIPKIESLITLNQDKLKIENIKR